MKERDFLKISAYPKPIDKEWQDKIDAYIKEQGITTLGAADNTNKNPAFNGSTFFSNSFKEKWDE